VNVDVFEKDEREMLLSFLRSSLNVSVTLSGGKVLVDSEHLSLDELKKSVNKFVYHRNLNHKYWVRAEGNVVRIDRFEKAKKPEKRKREGTKPQTITHGW
jgi:hypothetical protein